MRLSILVAIALAIAIPGVSQASTINFEWTVMSGLRFSERKQETIVVAPTEPPTASDPVLEKSFMVAYSAVPTVESITASLKYNPTTQKVLLYSETITEPWDYVSVEKWTYEWNGKEWVLWVDDVESANFEQNYVHTSAKVVPIPVALPGLLGLSAMLVLFVPTLALHMVRRFDDGTLGALIRFSYDVAGSRRFRIFAARRKHRRLGRLQRIPAADRAT